MIPEAQGVLDCPLSRAMTKDGSARLLENLPADQHAADLAGAGADLIELGVAQQASGRIIVDIAVAAQALDGVERERGRALRRVEDRARRVLARGPARVAGARH